MRNLWRHAIVMTAITAALPAWAQDDTIIRQANLETTGKNRGVSSSVSAEKRKNAMTSPVSVTPV